MRYNRYIVSLGALAIALAGSSSALAAPEPGASDVGLEEIIVTARKREESLQLVPVSVTALSAKGLEARNITDLSQLARFTPNLVFDVGAGSAGGSAGANIYIRGIGQNEFTGVYEPGVGIYVDGVYFGRSVGSVMDVVDLARVEVLRGPQGTLFGKNTIGGAINMTSVRPDGSLGGFGEFTIGRFKDRQFRGAVQFPIAEDKVAARLAVSARHRDGYDISRITGEDQNNIDRFTVRATLLFTPADDWKITVVGDVSHLRQSGQAQHLIAFTPGNPIPGRFSMLNAAATPFQAFDSRWISAGKRYNFANGPSANHADMAGLGATVEWTVNDALKVTSITAYRQTETFVGVDVDGTPLDFQSSRNRDDQSQISQELRFSGTGFGSRLNWQVGLYYFDEHVKEFIQLRAVPSIFNLFLDQKITLDNTTYAAFGQATYKLLDKLSFTAGIRYNSESKHVVGDARLLPPINAVTLNPAVARRSPQWDSWTPKLSVEFQAARDVLLYGSVSRGFKAGAVNFESQRIEDFQVFDPETVTSFEIGAKTEWFDHRLRFNGSAFLSNYKDMQLKAAVAPGQFTCPTTVTTFCSLIVNAANVRIKGFEAELTARPVDWLELFGGVGHIHNQFRKVIPALASSGIVTLDTQIPKTPKWMVNLGGEVTVPLNEAANLRLRADYAYRSQTFQEIRNVQTLSQPGYGLLNLRASVSRGPWEFALSGLNVTDKTYLTSGAFLTTGISIGAYGAPRTWTASIKYNFGN